MSELTKDHMRLAALYLHRRGIEMTHSQLVSAKFLDQDIIVRALKFAGKPTLDSDREFFDSLQKGTLPL